MEALAAPRGEQYERKFVLSGEKRTLRNWGRGGGGKGGSGDWRG